MPMDFLSLFKSFADQASGPFFCDSEGKGDIIFFLNTALTWLY